MSNEKKVRELLDQTRVIMGPIRRFDDEVQKALSEPPDVVVLLRWAHEQHAWATLGPATTYTSVRCEALWDVIKELEKTVRLTDDGWEWVEERE